MRKTKPKYLPTVDRATFEAMPPVEKRRTVAQHVLAALEAGRLKASTSCDLIALDKEGTIKDTDDDAAELLARKGCYACAIGAAVVVTADLANRANDFLAGDDLLLGHYGDSITYLEGVAGFDSMGVRLMEYAYEGRGAEAAANFGAAYEYGAPRLRAIWQAVLAHPEATFDPAWALENVSA